MPSINYIIIIRFHCVVGTSFSCLIIHAQQVSGCPQMIGDVQKHPHAFSLAHNAFCYLLRAKVQERNKKDEVFHWYVTKAYEIPFPVFGYKTNHKLKDHV